MKNLKIVFMGTPEFAVTVLKRMLEEDLKIAAVITAPDRPAGRGRKITESAVKTFSLKNDLKILQPTNLKDENFISSLRSIDADLFIVVAFRMLPEVVWKMPKKGTVNLHASILPNYRGAAPINWAIINGEKETGVTTFFIEKEIDTGNIILSRKKIIKPNTTAGELHDDLALIGSQAIIETITEISNETIKTIPQKQIKVENLRTAPKIFKTDCLIDWNQPSKDIHNFIRGLSPFPGAWSRITFKNRELTCKFFNSNQTKIKVEDKIDLNNSLSFNFPCKDYYLSIDEIQIEGKKRMNFVEFSKGNYIIDLKLLNQR